MIKIKDMEAAKKQFELFLSWDGKATILYDLINGEIYTVLCPTNIASFYRNDTLIPVVKKENLSYKSMDFDNFLSLLSKTVENEVRKIESERSFEKDFLIANNAYLQKHY